MANLSNEPSRLTLARDGFELVPYIEETLGERGIARGDYVAFHRCPCGHHDCLRVYPHVDHADYFKCYSTSSGESHAGTIIDWIAWTESVDDAEAARRLLSLSGQDDIPSQRCAADVNGQSVSNVLEDFDDNPYVVKEAGGQRRKNQTLAAYTYDLERDHALDGVRLDTFTGQIVVACGLPWNREAVVWHDIDTVMLQKRFGQMHGYDDARKLDAAIQSVAFERRFDSLEERFERLEEWDGRERVERFFCRFLGAEDSEYTRAASRLFFLGAVARVYQPGVKFDYMPVLVGPQGIGKSALCRALALEDAWFSDDLKGIGTKEASEGLRGKFIVEVSEFDAMRNRNATIDAVKGFITRSVDSYRPPYGKTTQDFPRRCVLIGTTNDRSFLVDTTGNRRFLPILCGGDPIRAIFDRGTVPYIEKTWAEARALYQSDPTAPLTLPSSVVRDACRIQEETVEDDPWIGMIGEWLETRTGRVCAMQIALECLEFDRSIKPPNRADTRRIHSIMQNSFADTWRRLPSKQKVAGFGAQRCYERR